MGSQSVVPVVRLTLLDMRVWQRAHPDKIKAGRK